ncbi:hypothetical protein [Paenibacillus xylanivorans]|uniref:hypothetical protein n=1 Tax=Paenibacillus xylanivorans TaxID=1705561 RepID=UPI000AD98133|nr:hypothetical protein [Paenibacillus xylanivorans]
MNSIPIPLLSAGVSALIAVTTFLILHFFIEPYKEKKRRKFDRLHILYSPLYALIVARAYLFETFNVPSKSPVVLGSIKDHEFLTKEFTDKLMFDKSAYASTELLDAWGKYVSSIVKTPDEVVERFVKVAVKDYNELKKELGMDYDKEEYKTGLPKNIRLRTSK